MEQITIRPLVNLQELKAFECGVEQMDKFIHDGLERSVCNSYCKTYGVYNISNHLVAFFALSFDSLHLDSDDIDDLQQGWADTSTPEISEDYMETFWSKVRYPAIEIAYLAVSKDYRGKNLGRSLIDSIANMARTQDLAGCQFLTVDALATKEYSAVGFYSKCKFARAEPVPVRDTLRMYYNLLTE